MADQSGNSDRIVGPWELAQTAAGALTPLVEPGRVVEVASVGERGRTLSITLVVRPAEALTEQEGGA